MKPGEILEGGFAYVADISLNKVHSEFSTHRRLKVFHHKGFKCVTCGREGEKLVVSKDRSGSIHIDVFTRDYKLMTIDHIIPKSKGGHKTSLDNLQPMCMRCNSKKSDKLPNEEVRIRTCVL